MTSDDLQQVSTLIQQTIQFHRHKGIDSARIDFNDLTNNAVASGVTSITGTANQIIVTGTTTPNLSTPQNIDTGASVRFASLGLGTAPIANSVMAAQGQYYSIENNIGGQGSNFTVDWSQGNVQYVTLTNNVTITFSNPKAGSRYLLHVAGAFTPTFPASVRWPSGVTPTPTAVAGKKDIYTFVYCNIENLYDGAVNQNYSVT